MIRMSPSTLLVYEFFTGGGCLGKDIPADLAVEALGMLWALLVDFRLWGEVRTIAAIDSRVEDRIPGLNRNTLPANQVIPISEDCWNDPFSMLLECCDAALIIAPETDDILTSLTRQAEKANIPVLGSCSAAVSIAGNKASCYKVFQNKKLPLPPTQCLCFDSAADLLRQMSFPIVIKPIDGAGSDGVCCIRGGDDIEDALEHVRSATSHDQFLLQPFITGQHISVSVLSTQNRCMPISLNEQLVETGARMKYHGSRVPLVDSSAPAAMELACSAVKSIQGLKGYVGVDLILAEGSAQLIEINPRLTTSYVGLRQVCHLNLAEVIWNACMHGIMPERIQMSGQTIVKKDDFNTWGLSDWLTKKMVVQG